MADGRPADLAPLPQRVPQEKLQELDFHSGDGTNTLARPITRRTHIPPAGLRPAEDMAELQERLLALVAVAEEQEAVLPLGGNLFDVVITAAGPAGHQAVAAMDALQRLGCGPVIADEQSPWLWWLVPPRTTSRWKHHPYGVSLGAPATITMPPLHRANPPDGGGTYWLRPCSRSHLVGPEMLRQALDQHRPLPAPHEAVAIFLMGATP